jgi:hypothetical protein
MTTGEGGVDVGADGEEEERECEKERDDSEHAVREAGHGVRVLVEVKQAW